MRKSLLLLIVIAVALSLGCGKKEEAQKEEVVAGEEAQKTEKPTSLAKTRSSGRDTTFAEKRIVLIDAVTGEKFLQGELPYSFPYKGKTYSFKTLENLNLFKENPEKYISKNK